MSTSIPSELIQQIHKGNCVLFLGPSATIPEFDTRLAGELAQSCDYHLPHSTLPKVAQQYEMQLKRHSLVTFVSNWLEKQSLSVSNLDQFIATLPFNTIVTTRMDIAIEDAYHRSGKTLIKIVRDAEVAFGDLRETILIKIHGSIEQKDTLVLTEKDHYSIFTIRPLLCDYLKILYATKTILFIGCNLDETHFQLMHREIAHDIGSLTRRSYAIWKGASEYSIRYWHDDNIQVIDLQPAEFLLSVERELSKLALSHKPNNSIRPEKKSHSYPYKFLDHFDSEDQGIFYGRNQEIELLCQRIMAHRLLVVFGTSGVGKTSIIKAGVMPKLRDFDAFSIYARCLDDPMPALTKFISDAISYDAAWASDTVNASGLSLLERLIKSQNAVGKRLVLFIDQFEELFRLPYAAQQTFLEQITNCIDAKQHLDFRLVLSIRDDFLAELESLQTQLPFLFRNIYRLRNLSDRDAVDAIIRPLDHFHVKFEDKLVETIIDDIKTESSVAPAQLQIICSRLYEKYANEKIIRFEDYKQSGSARKLLGDYLEEVLERFNILLRGDARRILKKLVSTQKRKVLLSDKEIASQLPIEWSRIQNTIAELETYRLLRRVETENDYKYELMHEYLVDQVWQWFSVEESKVKEIQELIDTETRYWFKYYTPIGAAKLDDIYKYWDQLVFNEQSLALLFRSSLAFGQIKQWEQVATDLGQRLIPLYIGLLTDIQAGVTRQAAIALIQLGHTDKLNEAMLYINPNAQNNIRQAMRQYEDGRSAKDMADEVGDPTWRERSKWNTSSIVGIDFGTTSSAIAIIRNDNPIIIPNREGNKFTPSVVGFSKNGEVCVGTSALLQSVTNAERTVFSIKRHLGSDWSINIDGTIYSAIDVAAFIFKSLKSDAESYLGREVIQATVSIPAYFDGVQVQAVQEAAERAGFEVLRTFAEPTSAAVTYGLDATYDRNVAVYDLGGGTFDISILEIGDGVVEVKSVNGNASLGGDDFDNRIIKYLLEQFSRTHQIDLSKNHVAQVRLKEAAERAKIALSGLETVNVFVPYIYADQNGIKHLDIDLSRQKFEQLTNDLVDDTLHRCQLALKDAELNVQDIDEVIPVGLSTKIPLVRQKVTEFFQREPLKGVDPDESVALGAAVQAGVLDGQVSDILLLNVTSFSFSIETAGGQATVLIPRNKTIPTKKREIFSTHQDEQTQIAIHILQGESAIAKDNVSLGCFIFDRIAKAPKGTTKLEITFDIDANGVLKIIAQEKSTNREIEYSFGLNKHSLHTTTLPRQNFDPNDLPASVEDNKKALFGIN